MKLADVKKGKINIEEGREGKTRRKIMMKSRCEYEGE
jgi:hypothetical protein